MLSSGHVGSQSLGRVFHGRWSSAGELVKE